ncbi:hypothetical protein [Methylosinus sp. Sm6]|uniref:hypothetical protein n=1 Tax=Methylosinus sp. Sm6 TaxID=2866948 RepID=UPI001C99865E|nr:hypothetical protein [Methylosinus sp. Sm6]MBY6243617.1 hypothetical protein [Methylosinus sp. Sm6]
MAALLAASSLSPLAQAAEPSPSAATGDETAPRSLNPAQIAAVRAVGRNVLAAKASGAEDAANVDVEQLARLRSTLDALIAADLDPNNRTPIAVQGQESSEQRASSERVAALRESARAEARALSAQLRSRSEREAADAQAASGEGARSAGLPIGAQRARLFQHWSDELDAAAAEDGAGRIAQLQELRDRLRPAGSGVSQTAATPATPTLQAMPAGAASDRGR